MLNLFRTIKWYLFRRENSYPCGEELRHLGAIEDFNEKLRKGETFKRKYEMVAYLAMGMSLEEVANHFVVTRERVRQLANKYYREKTKKEEQKC